MMKSWVCIDANIVVGTLVYGPYSTKATKLLRYMSRNRIRMLAPSLLPFEVVSTLRRLIHLKVITPQEGDDAFQRFTHFNIRLSHRKGIFPLAWAHAKQFGQPRSYDTTYLAVAQLNNCEFWTADKRLYNAVKKDLPWVKYIENCPQ